MKKLSEPVNLDSDLCHTAVVARDHRFDGLFFTAVKTTRLYCRPICPGRPKRENVEFFESALSAEAAGYRPCLRCRPEDAPSKPKSHVRGLELSTRDEGERAESSNAVRTANVRLDFSRKLVIETGLSLKSIAKFSSLRSDEAFNAAFEARFRREPSSLRKERSSNVADGVELSLSYRPPLDWQALLGFYRSHLIHGLERVEGDSYERVFELGSSIGVFRIEADRIKPQLRLHIVSQEPQEIFEVHSRVRRMFDLNCDPMDLNRRFASHPILGDLWSERPGLRIGRGWAPFEVAVSTILGQLVSTAQGRALVRQLIESHGRAAVHPSTGELIKLFPSPETLASASLDNVRTSNARKNAIRSLSAAVASGALNLSGEAVEEMKRCLLSLPGIGPWTSEYIGMRALGDDDSFPGTDLVLKRVVSAYTGMNLDLIRPCRAYAAICLWASHP